jgi:hypothetical protein
MVKRDGAKLNKVKHTMSNDPDLNLEDDEDDDDPLTPEEREELERYQEQLWEERAVALFGPRAERQARGREFVADLVSRYTEPVLRGILIALSRLKDPRCAQYIAEHDLATVDLADVIQPFEIYGLNFEVLAVDGDAYTVEIFAGYETTGSGGQFLLTRRGDHFEITDTLRQRMA